MASPAGGGRGRGRGGAGPQVIVATTKDGREIRGVRRNEDTFSVQMVDASGQLHLLDKLQLASFRVEPRSLMPGDYATKLTPAELNDVLGVSRRAARPRHERGCDDDGARRRHVRSAEARDAEPQNWLMYWGNYQGMHYTGLKQIDPEQRRPAADGVGVSDARRIRPRSDADRRRRRHVPTQPGVVVALDARTGRQIWRYARAQKVKNPYEINPFNRGVAVLGNRLYRRHARRGTDRARRAHRIAALGDRRSPTRCSAHSITSRAARREGQGPGRDHRRRVRRARVPRCLRRRERSAAVALARRAGSGRIRQRHVARRQLEAGRQPDVADRLVRSGAESRLLDRRQPGAADRSDRRAASSTTCSAIRWSRSIPTPVSASGTTSSRRTTATIGTRVRTSSSSIACGAVQPRKLLLHAGSQRSSSTCSIGRTASCCPGTPFVHANWTSGFDADGRPIQVPGSNSSPERQLRRLSDARRRHELPGAVVQPAHRLDVSRVLGERAALRERAGAVRSRPAVHRPYRSDRRRAGRSPASRAHPPASRRSIPRPAGASGISRSFRGSLTNGVLATAGNIVFGAIRDGNLVALDAKSGAHLWHVQTRRRRWRRRRSATRSTAGSSSRSRPATPSTRSRSRRHDDEEQHRPRIQPLHRGGELPFSHIL